MSELKYIPFEKEDENIKTEVAGYWTERAGTFFVQRQHELESEKAGKWLAEIRAQFSKIHTGNNDIKILDVGCGAGFFPVLLGREGYEVTGIDLTEEMIRCANELLSEYGLGPDRVKVFKMDAENPDFPDETFDVVISRNLTWTLPHPIEAYSQWLRVLKKGGLLLNFDAEYAKGAHALNAPENIAHRVVSEELKERCHQIYHMLTISALDRPGWDLEVLRSMGVADVSADMDFADRIFTCCDQFYIPDRMFMISAVK